MCDSSNNVEFTLHGCILMGAMNSNNCKTISTELNLFICDAILLFNSLKVEWKQVSSALFQKRRKKMVWVCFEKYALKSVGLSPFTDTIVVRFFHRCNIVFSIEVLCTLSFNVVSFELPDLWSADIWIGYVLIAFQAILSAVRIEKVVLYKKGDISVNFLAITLILSPQNAEIPLFWSSALHFTY